MKNISKKLEN